MTNFEAVLSRITNGESVSPSELLSYLLVERREHRKSVNTLLAKAYLNSGREENLQHAKVFIQRAWLLSRFSPEMLPLYIQIHSALGDIPGIRDAYKRVGMMMASEGNISEAIKYFDLWQYAYGNFKSLDKYEYDFDILDCMDRIARPYRFSPKLRPRLLKHGKIRLAYLMKGITELGSVLIKINSLFAKHHDRSRFEPMFFVPESKRAVLESPEGPDHLRLFEEIGCKLIMAPDVSTTKERLLSVAQMINAAGADVLITSAGLANFEHYFISTLRPAPIVMGLVQGPPQQFAPLFLDRAIVWSIHPFIDCPVDCSRVIMGGGLPVRSEITPYDRRELGIPDNAFVIVSAGRYFKFQEPAFWQAAIDLLEEHPQAYYLAMGVKEEQVPFLSSMLSQEMRSRIRLLSWRGNVYLRGLCLADALIDTFPSGGGGILLDAIALGIPLVSFENNYMRPFDQVEWSSADEFISIPELKVPRGDFEQMKRIVSRLIDDQNYRRDIAQRSKEHILETRGDAARSVRDCEEVYIRFLEEKLSGRPLLDPRGAEIEELARQLARPQIKRGWISWTAYQLKRTLQFGERVIDRVAEESTARWKTS